MSEFAAVPYVTGVSYSERVHYADAWRFQRGGSFALSWCGMAEVDDAERRARKFVAGHKPKPIETLPVCKKCAKELERRFAATPEANGGAA